MNYVLLNTSLVKWYHKIIRLYFCHIFTQWHIAYKINVHVFHWCTVSRICGTLIKEKSTWQAEWNFGTGCCPIGRVIPLRCCCGVRCLEHFGTDRRSHSRYDSCVGRWLDCGCCIVISIHICCILIMNGINSWGLPRYIHAVPRDAEYCNVCRRLQNYFH